MKRVFAPGCALMLYKPYLATGLFALLEKNMGEMTVLKTCCKKDPQFKTTTEVINTCPGCDKRYRLNYPNTSTVSLWEVLAHCDFFPFPDYHGQSMSIMDACPTRDRENIHMAIRLLLQRMNISLVEPKHTKTGSICCGDSFYGVLPTAQVKEQMVKRAAQMPVQEVVVYCVGCTKSVFIGGKRPRYLIDLLFGEETLPQTIDLDLWHKELDDYIQDH